MRRRSFLTGFMLIVVVLSAGRIFAQSAAEYKAKIEKINKEMTKDMLEGNTEKNLALYTTDAISMPSYEPMREGIAAIRKASDEMMKMGWKVKAFEAKTLKVIPEGNFIHEIGTYTISMSMPGMEKPMDDHGKYLTVWEKQKDGSLKVKIETWNTDVNPMSHMGNMEDMGQDQKKK